MAMLKHKTIKLPTFKLLLDGLNDLQLLSTDNNLFEDCFVNTDISNHHIMISFTVLAGDTVRLIAKQSRPLGKKLVNPDIEIRVYNQVKDASFNLTPKDLDNVPSFINSEYKPMRMLRDFLQLVLSEHCRIVKLKDNKTTEEELVRLRAENEALQNKLQDFLQTVVIINAKSYIAELRDMLAKDVHYNAPFRTKQNTMLIRLVEAIDNLEENNDE